MTMEQSGEAGMPAGESGAFAPAPGLDVATREHIASVAPSSFGADLEQFWATEPGLSDVLSFEQYAATALEHNSGVNAWKPLGCISLADVVSVRPDVERYIAEIEQKGSVARIFWGAVPTGWEGILYSYHPEALQAVLDTRRGTLLESGWPTTADAFVEHVAIEEPAPFGTPLYDLVADAFRDYENPNRLVPPSPSIVKHGILGMH